MGQAYASNIALKEQVLGKHKKATKTKGIAKPTTIASYVGVFLLVITLVALGYQPPQKVGGTVASVVETTSTEEADPAVDQLVATSVAGDLAERTNLQIAPNIATMAVTLSAKSELSQTDDSTISKPQIVEPTAGSRDIKTYTTASGDSVQEIADRYGIKPVYIKWANDLTSDALEPGKRLVIPPRDGVIYTVKSNDSIESLATRYKTDKSRIISYNDLELSGLKTGKKIIIPDATLPTTERPGYVAPPQPVIGGYDGGSGRSLGAVAGMSAGNRYSYGYCTWYAYERRAQLGRPIGSFWGDAANWDNSAIAAGFKVNNYPAPGAIFVEGTYTWPGHVGVVESVAANGDVYVTEMNNYAYGGWGIKSDRTIPAATARGLVYIH